MCITAPLQERSCSLGFLVRGGVCFCRCTSKGEVMMGRGLTRTWVTMMSCKPPHMPSAQPCNLLWAHPSSSLLRSHHADGIHLARRSPAHTSGLGWRASSVRRAPRRSGSQQCKEGCQAPFWEQSLCLWRDSDTCAAACHWGSFSAGLALRRAPATAL